MTAFVVKAVATCVHMEATQTRFGIAPDSFELLFLDIACRCWTDTKWLAGLRAQAGQSVPCRAVPRLVAVTGYGQR